VLKAQDRVFALGRIYFRICSVLGYIFCFRINIIFHII